MKKKTIPSDLKARLFELKCRAKRGLDLTKEEHEFCTEMYNKYPKDYSAMERPVFEATAPIPIGCSFGGIKRK